MRPWLRAAVLVGSLVAASAPTMALADATSQAEARYREGLDAFNRWQFDDARLAFLQAYALDAQPRYLWDLALAEFKAGHPVDAIAHFRTFTSLATATAEDRKKAEAFIAQADTQVGHILVSAPPGTLITVDDSSTSAISPLPDAIDVAAGSHVVHGRLGTREQSATATPRAGEKVTVAIQFEPVVSTLAPAQPAPPPAIVEPTAPARGSSSSARWIVSAVVVGAGVASVVVGAAKLVEADHDADTVQQIATQTGSCPPPPRSGSCLSLKDANDSRVSDQNIGTVFAALGAGLTAVGVGTWLLWPHLSTSPVASLTPILGPGQAGARWSVTF